MSEWTYLFADLRTDTNIVQLDLDAVSLECRIGAAGTFSASLAIPSAAMADKARRVIEARTVVHAYRNGQHWAGPYAIWGVTPSGDDRGRISVSFQGAELVSYLARRQIRSDLTYIGTDQLAIARGLIDHMQAVRPEGDLGIVTGAETSGVLRDRVWYGDECATYESRMLELAGMDDSFEYRIAALGEDRVRTFLTGYPTMGRAVPEHRFEQPGLVLPWAVAGDGTKGATSFISRGEGLYDDILERQVPLMSSVVYRDDLLTAGWPLIDSVADYQGVTDVATLDGHSAQNAAQHGGTVRIPSATIRLPDDNSFTPQNLGDRVKLVLVNEWFPLEVGTPTYAKSHRVVGLQVTPATRGAGSDVATLTFDNTDT